MLHARNRSQRQRQALQKKLKVGRKFCHFCRRQSWGGTHRIAIYQQNREQTFWQTVIWKKVCLQRINTIIYLSNMVIIHLWSSTIQWWMEGAIKGAFGASIFPKDIPYQQWGAGHGATNGVSQPSKRIECVFIQEDLGFLTWFHQQPLNLRMVDHGKVYRTKIGGEEIWGFDHQG